MFAHQATITIKVPENGYVTNPRPRVAWQKLSQIFSVTATQEKAKKILAEAAYSSNEGR
jgi:hypothetical protein